MMTAKTAKEFGWGAHADEPSRATSIEQKLSNVATWFDNVLKDSLVANPGRNVHVKKTKKSLANLLGRARVHEADVVEPEDDDALQERVDLNSAYETGTLTYLTTNTVHGTRAADNLLLDWADVQANGVGTAASEPREGELRGLALKFQKTKNNPEQRDRPAKPLQCLSSCKLGAVSMKVGTDGKQEGGGPLCPAHLLLRLRELQARDVGVAVAQLEGPVYGDYCTIDKLPAGATLVKAESGSASEKAPRLVLVVSRDEEAAGLMYDRTVPFEAGSKYLWPPCAGVYFEVARKGYAVHAWASAAGVTQRMRTLMRMINRRAGAELIPNERIAKMSSKSLRVTMATRLYRAGVPMSEIVEMGEWEDEAMARTYIRTLQPFAGARRNNSDVVARQRSVAAVAAGVATAADGQVECVEHPLVEAPVLSAAHVHEQLQAHAEAAVQPDVQDGEVEPAAAVNAGAAAQATPQAASTTKRSYYEMEAAVCCPDKYVAQGGCVLRTKKLEEDVALRRLWEQLTGEPARKVQRAMCTQEYHCSRKEINNCRARLKERQRCAGLEAIGLDELRVRTHSKYSKYSKYSKDSKDGKYSMYSEYKYSKYGKYGKYGKHDSSSCSTNERGVRMHVCGDRY